MTSFPKANAKAADHVGGHAHRLVFTQGGGGGGDNVPQQLSSTGCINTATPGAPPLLSLIPYRPNAAFWSDGLNKERWIGLPRGQSITVRADGDWDFPNGTVLVKHFRFEDRLVETRPFMRHPDGGWAGYTYQWNQDQTDATRVRGGATVQIDGRNWRIPSESECMQCHTQGAGYSLGLESAQQNGDHLYPQTGRTANQITTLRSIGVLSGGTNAPIYADPADENASLGDRARSYLHTNCANCHRPQGGTPVALDLHHDTALPLTRACDVLPMDNLGIANARIIAPGDAARSILVSRMARRGDGSQMPPVGSNRPDDLGVQLVADWINSLTSCQ